MNLATCGSWESWFCPSSASVLGRAGPVPCQGVAVELTLLMGAEVSQPEDHELVRSGPVPHLHTGRNAFPASPTLCHLWELEELILPLKGFSTWESGPWTSPEQRSRVDSGGVDAGEPPMGMRTGELVTPLAGGYTGWSSQGSAGEFALVLRIKERWWADQPSYWLGPNQGLWDGPPKINPTYELLEPLMEPVLQTQSCRISMTYSSSQISQRSPSEGSIMIEEQKPKGSNQTDDSF